jgi:hypothetical protein
VQAPKGGHHVDAVPHPEQKRPRLHVAFEGSAQQAKPEAAQNAVVGE